MSSILLPERIKRARESRGYSMKELGEVLGVTKQMVANYESGSNEPSTATLFKLIQVLQYPLSYFQKTVNSRPIPAPTFFRSRKTTPVKIKQAARIMAQTYYDEVDSYIRNFINFPQVSPDFTYFCDSKRKYSLEEIEDITVRLRGLWELGIGPIINLTAILQEKGCVILKLKVRDRKVDAFSINTDQAPYIFVSSTDQSAVRLRFDLAHELGHLILHRYYSEEDLDDKELYDTMEDEANYFAGSFLLPRVSFSQDVHSSSINHFLLLKKKWKVSISSMIYRCANLSLLSDNQLTYLKNQMTERVYWRHEPFDDVWEMDKPFMHKQAIKLLLESKVLTLSQLRDDLSLQPEELEEALFLDKGMLTDQIQREIISLRL
jgi:Zn-dependent peptidase ImmA (M78 family)/transcriptional regulator with XRE-family HTH domain